MVFRNMSTLAWAVARRGLPRMTGILKSSIMSSMTKSIGRINLSIFMSRFLTIPFGMHLVSSAISITILIGSSFPIPKLLNIEKGIMLMLAPRSTKALLKSNLPIEHVVVIDLEKELVVRKVRHSGLPFVPVGLISIQE
ncbi:hypothetical protein Tco_0424843 [Tanacetum coccineum]